MESHPPKSRPNLDTRWFWDLNVEKLDWQANYCTVIGRILERGSQKEWSELTAFYGYEKVIHALKNEINFLPDYTIQDVCDFFKIKREELKCYSRKLSRPGHWI